MKSIFILILDNKKITWNSKCRNQNFQFGPLKLHFSFEEWNQFSFWFQVANWFKIDLDFGTLAVFWFLDGKNKKLLFGPLKLIWKRKGMTDGLNHFHIFWGSPSYLYKLNTPFLILVDIKNHIINTPHQSKCIGVNIWIKVCMMLLRIKVRVGMHIVVVLVVWPNLVIRMG